MLVGTLAIKSKYLFGHTSRNVPIYLFYPYDATHPPLRVGCSSKEGVNKIGLVKAEPLAPGEQYARGTLVQILGTAGDPAAETLALLYQYAPLTKKILTSPMTPAPSVDFGRYKDWTTKTFTFNVDPPGCQDIDDVITVEEQSDGTFFFAITIANLLELVNPGSQLDAYAQAQATTLYSEGQAIAPMLPRWLSEGEASFLPETNRRGLALCCSWDGKSLSEPYFQEVYLRNQQSFTYETIYEHPVAKTLGQIASFLKGSDCTDSHEWIEQCMVYYNKQVANCFLEKSTGFLRALKEITLQRLEQKSAAYTLPSSDATHAAFAHSHYTHATSPIRRYADLLAQRYLLALLKNTTLDAVQQSLLDTLNLQMKQAARFERDMFLMKKLSEHPTGLVEATVLGWTEKKSGGWKLAVEVPSWNRILSLPVKGQPDTDVFHYTSKDETHQFALKASSKIQIQYFADLTQPNWKRRLVCALKEMPTN